VVYIKAAWVQVTPAGLWLETFQANRTSLLSMLQMNFLFLRKIITTSPYCTNVDISRSN
jgi:hypothetical protein